MVANKEGPHVCGPSLVELPRIELDAQTGLTCENAGLTTQKYVKRREILRSRDRCSRHQNDMGFVANIFAVMTKDTSYRASFQCCDIWWICTGSPVPTSRAPQRSSRGPVSEGMTYNAPQGCTPRLRQWCAVECPISAPSSPAIGAIITGSSLASSK